MKTPFAPHAQRDIVHALAVKCSELKQARYDFYYQRSLRDHLEARLIEEAPRESQAAKERYVKASKAWFDIEAEYLIFKSNFEDLLLQYAVIEKEYQSQYQDNKLDAGLIRKGIE